MPDHVEVIGSGSASAVPDVVALDLRIRCDAEDVAAALGAAASAVTDLLSAATAQHVEGRDRHTTGMGVSPRRDRDGIEVLGYTAYQSLRVLVRDRERVGEVLGALATAAGDAFGLDAVSLELADPAPTLAEARRAAFADARHRAHLYADAAGRTLGPVLEIAEEAGGAVPVVRRSGPAMAMASMPVEAGEATVSATVRVRFALGG